VNIVCTPPTRTPAGAGRRGAVAQIEETFLSRSTPTRNWAPRSSMTTSERWHQQPQADRRKPDGRARLAISPRPRRNIAIGEPFELRVDQAMKVSGGAVSAVDRGV